MSNLDQVTAGYEINDRRMATLKKAESLGADVETLAIIRDAVRVKSNSTTIILPVNRMELLSRGRGWARLGTKDRAQWGDRVDGGYSVGPGRWVVGGNDGFSRKREDLWNVKNISVGAQVWTVAS